MITRSHSPPSIDELLRQNRALDEQLRQLLRTERRLYVSQREVERQLSRFHALNRFALAASAPDALAAPRQILVLAAEMLFAVTPYEQVVALLVDEAGQLRPVAVTARLGREAESEQALTRCRVALPVDTLDHLAAPLLLDASTDDPAAGTLCRCVAELFTEACSTGQRSAPDHLVLPLRREHGALCAVLVMRCIAAAITYHDHLPGPEDLVFLELVRAHVEGALEGALLRKELGDLAADLERRVERRTAELAEANRTLDSNLRQLREAQDHLLNAGKMAAIGTLVAGLSHEINNPIGVIVGFSQSLLRVTDEGSPLRKPLESIERQAKRCARLINTLLDFSRQGAPVREVTEAHVLVERVMELSAGQARRQDVQLSAAIDPALPPLHVCATEIESALLNVVNNSLDAVATGGCITIRAYARAVGTSAGVELSVEDDGPGIAPELHLRIFDPFFTTKAVGKGTGLGLALTQKIIESHGGQICLDSCPGAGTTVHLWLPAAERDP